MNEVLFSSNKEDWETPIDFFNILDEEFHFSLDPCADHNNHKCRDIAGKRWAVTNDVLRKHEVHK